MVMSYIITGRDSRVHVITAAGEITKAVFNSIKRLGCSEVAIRSSEKIPEREAEIRPVSAILPKSLGTTSAAVLSRDY